MELGRWVKKTRIKVAYEFCEHPQALQVFSFSHLSLSSLSSLHALVRADHVLAILHSERSIK